MNYQMVKGLPPISSMPKSLAKILLNRYLTCNTPTYQVTLAVPRVERGKN